MLPFDVTIIFIIITFVFGVSVFFSSYFLILISF